MARVFISVGSNIEPEKNVIESINLLSEKVNIVAISTFYLNKSFGDTSQPDFYNGVLEIETDSEPYDLKFSVLRVIEEKLGRRRSENKNKNKFAPRTIDLDILVYDETHTLADDIKILDPDIAERPFLAIPLCELAGDIKITFLNSNLSLKDIVSRFKDHKMQPLFEYTEKLRKLSYNKKI